MKIKNWKLTELSGRYEVISNNGVQFRNEILLDNNIPMPNYVNGLNRSATNIEWSKMPEYYITSIASYNEENSFVERLQKSSITSSEYVIIIYDQEDLAIKIKTSLFVKDVLDFIDSVFNEAIIFSSDFKFIIEISRDYSIHSNFTI